MLFSRKIGENHGDTETRRGAQQGHAAWKMLKREEAKNATESGEKCFVLALFVFFASSRLNAFLLRAPRG
jgi:hypothetical protein